MSEQRSLNELELEHLAQEFRVGVWVTDRRWRFKKYKQCFIGSQAVDWLVLNGVENGSREAAVKLGQKLMDKGVFVHVTNEHGFKDDYLFYRFNEQAETKTINQFFGSPMHADDDLEILNSKYVPGSQCKLSQKTSTDILSSIDLTDNFNITLMNNIRPSNFVSKEPVSKYNLVIVGGGLAGVHMALISSSVGAKVAIVENNLIGGTHLNNGSVPSKALLRSSRVFREIKRAVIYGVKIEKPKINFPVLMSRMREVRAKLSEKSSVAMLQAAGVDVFIGKGKFTDKNTFTVNGQNLHFINACICTGATSTVPQIEGLSEINFLTTETFFNLQKKPKTLAILGGGYIGCEIAQAMARFRTKVHLLFKGENSLELQDPESIQVIENSMKEEGVIIHNNTIITSVKKTEKGKLLTGYVGGDEKKVFEIEVEHLLICTGRSPNVEGLGLEAAGVDYNTKDGVIVNDFLATSNNKIFAAGDVSSKFKFSHVANAMARTVVRNALFSGSVKAKSMLIPWCIFTEPQLGHVGLFEKDLQERNISYFVIRQDFKDIDRAVIDGETEGFIKFLVQQGNDKILGVTIVGNQASELLAEVTLAMETGVGMGNIGSVLHVYPTYSEAIQKCGDQYQVSRLNPSILNIFNRLLSVARQPSFGRRRKSK